MYQISLHDISMDTAKEIQIPASKHEHPLPRLPDSVGSAHLDPLASVRRLVSTGM